MYIQKFTSSLLLTCFFHQAVSTAAFAMLEDFESVERYTRDATAQGVLVGGKTSLRFKADAAHTAAGVLFYMLDPEGDYSVILGQRDDDPGFCSFFGKSDAGDGTLNVTAARESAEESMGLFAVHDYIVSRAPFADVYSAGISGDEGELRRMYICQTEYIHESRFDKKLSEATDSHSKEYKRFKTFKVRDLLESVVNKTLEIKTNDQEDVLLYEPLFDMLSTPFYQAALEQLAAGKRPIPLKASQKESYLRAEDYTKSDDGKVSTWAEISHDFEAIAKEATKRTSINAAETSNLIKKLKKFGHNLGGVKISPSDYETVQFTEQEEKEFAYTEAFRQSVMMELKSEAARKQALAREQEQTYVDELRRSDELRHSSSSSAAAEAAGTQTTRGHYTMTEGHLMLVLGRDYVEPTDFSNPAEHRLANIANLRKYFIVHNSMEYENKTAKEGESSRELTITDHLIERLADVMDLERREWIETGRFPVYHGTTDQNGHAFRIASIINNHLTLNATDHLTRLRYTDLYFREVANMSDDVAKYGDSHYDNGNRDRRLFGNFVLTAGRATSRSTSSTVEYWGNNHSVVDPNVQKRFEEGTALLGMNLAYAYYESLFQQFIADTGTAYGNALLLQMFISPEALTRYGATDCMDEKVALTAYHAAQAEYERIAQNGKEDFEPKTSNCSSISIHSPETEKKKGLFGEVRLQLHPNMMRDPSQLIAYGLDFFPLDAAKQRRFNNKLSEVTAANLGHWFSQKTALIPGSLMDTPTARNLYKMVHKGVTGSEIEDVPNTHSLLHLVRFGHIDAMKTLLETCPDLVESIDSADLFRAALSCGSKEKDTNGLLADNGYAVIKYVMEEIIRKPINEVFSENALLVYISTNDVVGSAFKYILESFDFTNVSMAAKEKIADSMLRRGDVDAIKNVHTRIRPYTDEDIAEKLIVPYFDDMRTVEVIETFIKANILTVERAATITLTCFK
ncbi:MAG: hypothetical protein V4482_05515 [Pseudomonadota bacterium]